MKRPKKPTRAQKVLMSQHRLVPDNWMVVSEDREELILLNKRGDRRVIKK